MRDSIGGIYAITVVLIFIVLMSGFLAYTTNYNKAYKMKNRIITILEKYDNEVSTAAQKEIQKYAKSIGYSADREYTSKCDGVNFKLDSYKVGWCYSEKDKNGTGVGGTGEEYTSRYVDVKTFVSIDIPVFNNIFSNIKYFTVTGATKQITKLKN